MGNCREIWDTVNIDTLTTYIYLRAGPRRSEDGGGGGGHWLPKAWIERLKPRGVEGVWEGITPLIRGGKGASPGKCFKIGLPESAFPCYFQAIFINFAGWFYLFFFFSVNFRRSQVRNCWATFFCGVILFLPLLIQEGQLSVSGEKMSTVLVNLICIKPAQEVRLCKLTGSEIT